jgi:hypothetical protein
MSRARDDEWTFVILGRDRAAPAVVRAWIEERVRLGKNKLEDPQIVEAWSWIREVLNEQAEADIKQKAETDMKQKVEKTRGLAERLADGLLANGRTPCERIVLMVGRYPDDKQDGGLCRASLIDVFEAILQDWSKE